MMNGLSRVLNRRMWFVPDVNVWGLPGSGEIEFLMLEERGSSDNLFFGTTCIGGATQTVRFDQLTDHRGNLLPSTLSAPKVLPRSKDGTPVFVVGKESDRSFKLAHAPDAGTPATADLLIVEMGD